MKNDRSRNFFLSALIFFFGVGLAGFSSAQDRAPEDWHCVPSEVWTCDATSGVFGMTGSGSANTMRFAYFDYDFEDVVVEADAAKIQGDNPANKEWGAYGILLKARIDGEDIDEYYYFGILTTGHYTIAKVDGATETIVQGWTVSDELTTGYSQSNTLRVHCSGNRFDFHINGTLEKSFVDDSFRTGKAALFAWEVENGVGDSEDIVEFENVTVTLPGDVYVSKTGDCGGLFPCETTFADGMAMAVFQPGCTVKVASGIYPEESFVIDEPVTVVFGYKPDFSGFDSIPVEIR